jgi:hypothetical protein
MISFQNFTHLQFLKVGGLEGLLEKHKRAQQLLKAFEWKRREEKGVHWNRRLRNDFKEINSLLKY